MHQLFVSDTLLGFTCLLFTTTGHTNTLHSSHGRPQHLSPPPSSTGKQLVYLYWSFPVTNVNRQHMKETRETGAHKGNTGTESESADMNGAEHHLTLVCMLDNRGKCGSGVLPSVAAGFGEWACMSCSVQSGSPSVVYCSCLF